LGGRFARNLYRSLRKTAKPVETTLNDFWDRVKKIASSRGAAENDMEQLRPIVEEVLEEMGGEVPVGDLSPEAKKLFHLSPEMEVAQKVTEAEKVFFDPEVKVDDLKKRSVSQK